MSDGQTLEIVPEDRNAAYLFACLEIMDGDRLVVLVDSRKGRDQIGKAMEATAQARGIEVLIVNLDKYFGEIIPAGDEQDEYFVRQEFKNNLAELETEIVNFNPNKSYLASDRPERGHIMGQILGCMPYSQTQTVLHTIHGHDPGITLEMFQTFASIDLVELRKRARRVRDILHEGVLKVHSALGTHLKIRLQPHRYPILPGIGEVQRMAKAFYRGQEQGGIWTNTLGGEVFTFPPIVEGTAVCVFRQSYWKEEFKEYEDLSEKVKLEFKIRPVVEKKRKTAQIFKSSRCASPYHGRV